MEFLKKIKVPTNGVMLGFAALGNLLQAVLGNVLGKAGTDAANASLISLGGVLRNICGIIAAILLILFILRLITDFSGFMEEMKAPPIAGVFSTFPMGIMLLATYLKPFAPGLAKVIWYAAIICFFAWMVYFTLKVFLPFDLKKVFASFFIVYAGIAVAGVTSEAFEAQAGIGTIASWIGLICGTIIVLIGAWRYLTIKEKPEPTKPLFCIFTAPLSLALAGYITAVTPKSAGLIIFYAIVCLALYIMVLISLPKWLAMPFFPSYAAFTFPFVISGIAMLKTMVALGPANMGVIGPGLVSVLRIIVLIQTVIATVLCIYTLIKFIASWMSTPKAA